MTDDPTAATPVANVPNTAFYHRFLGVAKWAVGAIALILAAMALFLTH